jgi:hypothetical protein
MMLRLLPHRLDKGYVQGVCVRFPAMQKRVELLQSFVI